MTAVPLLPSLVAVMVAVPPDWPMTRPPPLTEATDVLLLAQVMTRPVSVPPTESLVTAASSWVAPTRIVADAGFTVTVATGTLMTAMVALPVLPSLMAVTVADPAALPVTRPLALTAATAGALLAQVTMRPLRGAPLESWGAAASCKVAPSRRLATVGVTTTAATGVGTTVTVLVSAIPPAGVVATTM